MARARVTFNYTATYPVGLVEGVNALVFSSRGGVHAGQPTDAVTPYLRSVLGLMGIGDVQFIYAEGLDMKPHGLARGPGERSRTDCGIGILINEVRKVLSLSPLSERALIANYCRFGLMINDMPVSVVLFNYAG